MHILPPQIPAALTRPFSSILPTLQLGVSKSCARAPNPFGCDEFTPRPHSDPGFFALARNTPQ